MKTKETKQSSNEPEMKQLGFVNEIYEIIFNYDDVKEKDGCKLQL